MEDHYYCKSSENKKNNLKETFGGKNNAECKIKLNIYERKYFFEEKYPEGKDFD